MTPPARRGRHATTFVIVPGIGMSHRYSEPLRLELGRTASVVSLDLPGFAGFESTPEAERMPVAGRVRAIAAQLDARGITSAVLIGHSMGAQFAVELARLRPSLVSRLVLMAPVVDPRRRTARQQALDLVRDLFTERPRAAAIVTRDYLRTGPRRFFGALAAMLAYRTDEAVEQVQCPVLVMRGESDPIARRAWCDDLARRAGGARLIEIAGAGHLLQYTAAVEVAREIRAFAAESARSPDGVV